MKLYRFSPMTDESQLREAVRYLVEQSAEFFHPDFDILAYVVSG
jgi:hypothetical protein